MDMIVRLSDGSIANIEVQKIAALFPGERLSCYSADAIMRQYHRLSSSSALAQYNIPIPEYHTISHPTIQAFKQLFKFNHLNLTLNLNLTE